MKDRQSLAIILAALAVYLLVHAALAGYGVYLANEALRPPVVIDGPYLAELRDDYPTVVALFVGFAALGSLAVLSCVGFLRNADWADRLWLMTSAAAVTCVALAVVLLGVVWTQYLFELAAISVSWVYALRLRGARHEG